MCSVLVCIYVSETKSAHTDGITVACSLKHHTLNLYMKDIKLNTLLATGNGSSEERENSKIGDHARRFMREGNR